MSNLSTTQEILDYAISLEQNAVKLYTELAEKAKRPEIKKAFLGFADEERGHEQRLKAIKTGTRNLPSNQDVQDLKISDYHVDVTLEPGSSYQDILIFAMKQEKQAFKLYSDLAEKTTDGEIKSLFLQLAQEEAKHKLRFEIEYDDHVLIEN